MEEPLILDRYRPIADLGSGGYGSVVLAFDTRMARRVAIKRLPLPTDRAGKPLARTGLSEARTAALLNHPAIVTVHEWDTDDQDAYIVMEDIDGMSLADLVDATGGPLGPDEAAAALAAVTEAVRFAHDNGVLHLDIKPANVLVTRDGRVKVADFGISALTDASGRARGMAGTLGYMPPEQLRGGELDERTDQWALAALAYELLADANPFDADTPESSLFRIEVADVPLPSEFEPSLSPAVDSVLLAALAPHPDDRYESVADFAAALMPHLGDPQAGRESLAELVQDTLGDADESVDDFPRPYAWDRFARYSGIPRRALAAVASAWLAWVGLGPVLGAALGQDPVLMETYAVAVAPVALAGAVVPGLGLGLGIIALTAGLALEAGAGWAALFGVPAAAYWLWRARRGTGDALVPLFAPALGALRASVTAPLFAGYVFEPLAAAAASGLAALTTMTVAAAMNGHPPFLDVDPSFFIDPWSARLAAANVRSVFEPGPLIAAGGWALAGLVLSFFSSFGRRWPVIPGAFAAVVVLRLGYLPWQIFFDGPSIETLLPHAVIALMALAVVVALGPPVRGER